jgi:hypothetical protein
MRKMLMALSALVVLSGLVLAVRTAWAYETFYHFKNDRCIVGGITGSLREQMLADGWTEYTLSEDLDDIRVQFCPSGAPPVWRIGTVPEGTVYYYKSNMGFKIGECGNQVHQDTPLNL